MYIENININTKYNKLNIYYKFIYIYIYIYILISDKYIASLTGKHKII